MIPASRKLMTKNAVRKRASGKSSDGGEVRTNTPKNPYPARSQRIVLPSRDSLGKASAKRRAPKQLT
jgi:hypothetical protein